MHINDLPPEMLVKIFSFLPFQTLLIALEVCKKWKHTNDFLYSWKNRPVTYDGKRSKLPEVIALVEEYHEKIRNVVFRRVDFEEIHQVLARLPKLTRLEMIMCAADENLALDLLNYPELKSLQIRNCYVCGNRSNMVPYDINFFELQHLEMVLLSDFGLHQTNFDGFLTCTKLTEIFIEKIRRISQDNIIKLLELRKDQLKSLGIYGKGYTDEVCRYISGCRNITKLRILRCDTLTNRSLTFLQCLNLTQLILWNNTKFTNDALIELFENRNMHQLEVLSLSKITNMTMELLTVISKNCLELTSVGIYRCPCMEAEIQNPIVEALFKNAKVVFE